MAQFKFVEWIGNFLEEKTFQFEWDDGNQVKNELKHGVKRVQIEQALLDDDLVVLGEQTDPVVSENRFAVLGKEKCGEIIFIVFTIRDFKVRAISARFANRKERALYEK